ncbi:hypothetical protein CAPTEDRAFT_176329 [Capitella teleta]|uniref:Glycosyltransferase 2-like domain-containing protein n=1 Tax=Capitella teleta TaxID=283909 RepID=R7VI53_CAPTE|nr:hypothetical protein CAPTEDRAFT_176329 [Capitella teleta]|eukprot:ELU15390.1 hypothetical protein CAPTEDRAFT_176329 [Capitella teleta]
MQSAASIYDTIQKLGDDLIKNQNRAPDSRYNINVTFSDHTSLDRDIPDTRPEICRHFSYDLETFPKVSVIIPFYNEALSMLLRTIHSVLRRTPEKLLEEIILVDDKSTDPWLHESLDHYVNLLPKVKLIRNAKRVGLIVSRMTGARLSNAPVLVFQDAHTESNVGWLPPLLDEIKRHPNAVYQPFVDGIDAMNLYYESPIMYHKGSFSWDLRYTWLRMSDHETYIAKETGLPFFTPTLVGCVMAVDKAYFFSIGAFDEGLRVWGGENIELAFRTWMCGGKVTTVTCSRVGHVFKNFPYKFDDDKEEVVQKNLMRVAETWMDGMKKYFYAATRVYDFKRAEFSAADWSSVNERKKLREKLGCKTFEWFMYNVIPEMDYPPMDADFFGEIMNQQTRACWEIMDDRFVGMNYICYEHKIIPRNNFAMTKDGLLRYRDKCVMMLAPKPYLVLGECPVTQEERQKFGIWELQRKGRTWGKISVKRKKENGAFEHFCVTQVTNVLPIHSREQMPQIGLCDEANTYQDWIFTYGLEWPRVPQHTLTEPST